MKAISVVWLCVLSGGWGATEERASRVVSTAQGPVRGYRRPHTNYYVFYSIPYATAPTGKHKFREPLAAPTWEATFEAIEEYVVCPQTGIYLQSIKTLIDYEVREECLIANVYVPDKNDTKLSVLVYVHGGGYQIGFGNMVTHRALLEMGNVIVVNFNYRLGAHGFLCLGTDDAPGNAGMKDQVALLRWVKHNIAAFGGNPDDISLIGGSAGAASVELLSLSKVASGLFNKIIPESGSGVAFWSMQSKPLEVAKAFARSKGFEDDENIFSLEEFYKNLPSDQLHDDNFMFRRDNTMGFVPCIERNGSSNPFLTEAPVNIIAGSNFEKLPVLTGFTNMENIAMLNMLEMKKTDMNENFSDFLPDDLHFANEDERHDVADEIKKFYFGKKGVDEETALGYVNYMSDTMFAYPAYRSLSLRAAAGSTSIYFYVYALAESASVPDYPDIIGAGHCAQSMAMTDIIWANLNDTDISEDYKQLKNLLADLWHNFVLTGNPTPVGSLAASVLGEWTATSPAQPRHALFNASSELRGELWPERMALWDRVYSKYYWTPTPPPEPTKTSKNEL
nr:Carboxylic ester hydrolase [Metisa plana]